MAILAWLRLVQDRSADGEFEARYDSHGRAPDSRRAQSDGAGWAALLPPFAETPDAGILAAWHGYQRAGARPAGGLAPGVGWKRDGVSWTPETCLVAFTAAASGQEDTARKWLTWLDAHRRAGGSIPEKVLSDGTTAGPAPLGWSSANVVLAVDDLPQS